MGALALARDEGARETDAQRHQDDAQKQDHREPGLVDERRVGRGREQRGADDGQDQCEQEHEPEERARHHQHEEDLVRSWHASEKQAARPAQRARQEVAGKSAREPEDGHEDGHARASSGPCLVIHDLLPSHAERRHARTEKPVWSGDGAAS